MPIFSDCCNSEQVDIEWNFEQEDNECNFEQVDNECTLSTEVMTEYINFVHM